MSIEERKAENALTNDQIIELREFATEDAKDTFQNEQLAHWYWNVNANDPPDPQTSWLRNRWEYSDPCEAAWIIYRLCYRRALKRAMVKLDELWDRYAQAMDDDAEGVEGAEDPTEVDNETTDACVDAMEECPS